MVEERIYSQEDLHHGICNCCGEESDEITDDGCCIDCIEEEIFINNSMKIKSVWY